MVRDRPSPWLYVFGVPVLALNVVALVKDPARLGDSSSVADQPVAAVLGLSLFLAALVGGTWRYSRFRLRRPVAIAQLVLLAGEVLLYVGELHTHISWWDIVYDVLWVVTAATQLWGRGSGGDPGPPVRLTSVGGR